MPFGPPPRACSPLEDPDSVRAGPRRAALEGRSPFSLGCGAVRQILLHDTLSGELRVLQPRHPGRVGIYACGPTVYARIHVGNARPYVVFSLLKRFLVREGYEVVLVVNITDVNDKIYQAARGTPLSSTELAAAMTKAYIDDTDALELGRPDLEPLASEMIEPIIALIQRLVDSGHAYLAHGDVYFAVGSYPRYGQLSHRRVEELDQGEGLEGAERKRDPADFALWKAHKPGEDTYWEAPWGRGRPGWHVECSAMAETLLGLNFEIHGGGSDLIFPHHENEAAQTDAARGIPLAQLWVHNGMVNLEREKMAKSEGNIFLLHEALATYGRDALIAYFCAGHYRQPIEFSHARLAQARAECRRIREAGRALAFGPSPPWSAPLREGFFSALADDFNTPAALALLFDWVREANRAGARAEAAPVGDGDLREMLAVLALDGLLETATRQPPPDVMELLQKRETARRARDYREADAVRERIASLGWEVRDGPSGPELVPLEG
jgi:cysteinyl-tRNA synthetase